VYFEMGEYDKVVADCDAAVERGRELRADYKMVARALTRKGNALVKKGDLPAAIDAFHKSLTEHRCNSAGIAHTCWRLCL
jgi:stress-induced-phosphoprotein 1